MHGRYLFRFPPRVLEQLGLPRILAADGCAKEPLILPNTVVDEGEVAFLRMIARDFQGDVAGGADFFVGLADQIPDETDTLPDITSEPTVTNGYARGPLVRSSVGWPTEVVINGNTGIRSITHTFLAVGGPFSTQFSRAFLCNVTVGSVGTLFSYSGALDSAVTLEAGEPFPMQYELFMN